MNGYIRNRRHRAPFYFTGAACLRFAKQFRTDCRDQAIRTYSSTRSLQRCKTLEGLVETPSSGLNISLASSDDVRTGDDVIKTMIAGADVAVVVSEIYRQDPVAVQEILVGVRRFLDAKHSSSPQCFMKSRPSLDDRPR